MFVSRLASAQPPTPDLMARLAVYAERFEVTRTHASYILDGQLESLDGNGRAESVKAMKARIEVSGSKVSFEVIRYSEDGEDKTDFAKKKTRERSGRGSYERDKKEVRMPLLPEEQGRYVFEQVEVDRTDANRVRISFVPKVKDDYTVEGSTWVDTRTGTLLSAGFKLSKTPMFVDYLHFTVEFGVTTPLGPAVSTVHVEGKGGIPLFRKHFRASANFTDYRVAPP